MRTRWITRQSFVLSIGDDGAILSYFRNGEMVQRLYASQAKGDELRPFLNLFAENSDAPVHLLVDSVDQTYAQQALPPVNPMSVQRIAQRRLERDFSGVPLRGAMPLGRSQDGRRDWMYLFVALPLTPQLNEWLSLCTELPNPFGGIYALPVEACGFIQMLGRKLAPANGGSASTRSFRLPLPRRTGAEGTQAGTPAGQATPSAMSSPALSSTAAPVAPAPAATIAPPPKGTARPDIWQLLVAHNKVGGFRQIVVRNGKFVFTRLTQPIGDPTPEVIAGNIEQEMLNTLEYIKRLSFNEKAQMDVFAIVAQDIVGTLDLSKLPARTRHVLTPHQVGELLEMPGCAKPADRFADVLMAAAFALNGKPRLTMQTEYTGTLMMLQRQIRQLRSAVYLAVPLALAYLGYQGYVWYDTQRDIGFVERQQQEAAVRLQELRDQQAALPPDMQYKDAFVRAYRELEPTLVSPMRLLATFGQALPDTIRVVEASLSLEKDGQTTQQIVPDADFHLAVDLSFRNAGTPDARLTEEAESLLRGLKERFPDYEIAFVRLPGAYTSQETIQRTLTDSAPASRTVQEDAPAQLSIRGPVATLVRGGVAEEATPAAAAQETPAVEPSPNVPPTLAPALAPESMAEEDLFNLPELDTVPPESFPDTPLDTLPDALPGETP